MTKILFITPKLPNIANVAFNLPHNPVGGWIDSVLEQLNKKEDVELSVLSLFAPNTEMIAHTVNNIDFYFVSYTSTNVVNDFFNEHTFDLIQILGLEHRYTDTIIPVVPMDKVLLNVTGIAHECAKVYFKDIHSFNPLLLANLKLQQNQLLKNSKNELTLLSKAHYVTGRTAFDKQFIHSVNPDIEYYPCNEILRSAFYTADSWELEHCIPHRIFISQISWAIKGGHQALLIMAELKKKYPDLQVYIAGEDMSKASGLFTSLHANYPSYLMDTIKKNNLQDTIHFLGFINAETMIEELHKANVFLSPSVLENSSNSVQEAMLIGTPTVSSAVGGIPTICPEDTALLYAFDDVQEAVNAISSIFDNKELAHELSIKGSQHIRKLADPAINADTMYNIIYDILNRRNS